MNYAEFIESKQQAGSNGGFAPTFTPDFLFDFQRHLVDWSLRKGRAAIFADCGLGKTPMQLVWAENVARKINGRVLILAPIAVGTQTVHEGEKFGIEACQSRNGTLPPGKHIIVTNYEKLHLFSPADFRACVCDESSILKHFTGATQKAVTRFMAKLPYRLLCTATAAPNDFIELGTSSEALGELGYTDMLTRFFKMDDKKRCRMNDVKLARGANSGNTYAKLAYRIAQQQGAWRLKGHAEEPFWRWVCSWARACRMPSDLCFENGAFILPPLIERHHVVKPVRPADGFLFTLPAFGLGEEREERRRTLQERCEKAAELVRHDQPAVIWCELNAEGDLLEKLIPNSRQVSGADSDDEKEDAVEWFKQGGDRKLISKAKIFGFGLNLQHCAHVITFASHSYERYYQSVRRCWRFGQKQPVTVDVISSAGEQYVAENMARKQAAASKMFDNLVRLMNSALTVKTETQSFQTEIPRWLKARN